MVTGLALLILAVLWMPARAQTMGRDLEWLPDSRPIVRQARKIGPDEPVRRIIEERGSVVLQDPYNGEFLLKVLPKADIARKGPGIIDIRFDLIHNPIIEIQFDSVTGKADIRSENTLIALSDSAGHEIKLKVHNGGRLLDWTAYKRKAKLEDRQGNGLFDIILPAGSRLRVDQN